MGVRKPGLWLPFIKVEAQSVKRAHRKECFACAGVPVDVRLVVTVGTGRSQQKRVYCAKDGKEFVNRRIREANRMLHLLDGNTDLSVRLPDKTKYDPSWVEPKVGQAIREPVVKKHKRPLPTHMTGMVAALRKNAC